MDGGRELQSDVCNGAGVPGQGQAALHRERTVLNLISSEQPAAFSDLGLHGADGWGMVSVTLQLTRLLPSLEPMEEDILQVVKYCTDLIEEKDLEKLDLVIKYMKR